MTYIYLDIETNGYLENTTTVHCIATQHGLAVSKSEQKEVLMSIMNSRDKVVAHNAIKFDIPALQKVYPWFHIDEDRVVDTLVLSRLIYSHMSDIDSKLVRHRKMPSHLRGRHSLEAWGHRLGEHKGDFVTEDGWATYTDEMGVYCKQDVVVLKNLHERMLSADYTEQAIDLEMAVAHECQKIETVGFMFDEDKARELLTGLLQRRFELTELVQNIFTPWYAGGETVTPKVNNKTTGVTKGVPYCRVKLTEFNLSSRHHIANRLITLYRWKPEVFTPDGKPKIDETILSKMKYPEAQLLSEYFTVEKRISQIMEGKGSWFNSVRDGRLHGSINPNGAITGRATHNDPNLGQVPSVNKPYGKECRELFRVAKGNKLVGADLSGLELRCLAHYMARYDKGEYVKTVCEGDVHTVNQHAAGLPDRPSAKTFIYAFLYGAGNEKMGKIIGKGKKAGGLIKETFLAKTPALAKLIDAVKAKAVSHGHLIGLDGRRIHVRSAHAALNTLLQCAGSLLAKQAMVEFRDMVRAHNLDSVVHIVAWVHDEFQIECPSIHAKQVGEMAVQSFALAGEHFKFRCTITGEYKIGDTWKETH